MSLHQVALFLSGLLWPALILWYVSGLVGYTYADVAHRMEQNRRWQPKQMRWFPEIRPMLAGALLGPLLFILYRATRPAAPPRATWQGAGRESRERPAQADIEHDEEEPQLRVAQ